MTRQERRVAVWLGVAFLLSVMALWGIGASMLWLYPVDEKDPRAICMKEPPLKYQHCLYDEYKKRRTS